MQSSTSIGVLLVDDHRTMLWGLERLIQGRSPSMTVLGTAENCEQALEQARTVAPDVILLDLDLAGRCSLEILPELARHANARVLVLTAGSEEALLDAAMMKGARGVLHKTSSAEQVLKAIEKVHEGELWVDHERLGRLFMGMTSTRPARPQDPELRKIESLTVRERRILQTLVDESGASNKAIAALLFISEHTLRNHLTSIYQKLDVANRLELYVFAARHVSRHGRLHEAAALPMVSGAAGRAASEARRPG